MWLCVCVFFVGEQERINVKLINNRAKVFSGQPVVVCPWWCIFVCDDVVFFCKSYQVMFILAVDIKLKKATI